MPEQAVGQNYAGVFLPQDPEGKYEALAKYARDLTAAARDGKLDPVIGRDDEIRRAIQAGVPHQLFLNGVGADEGPQFHSASKPATSPCPSPRGVRYSKLMQHLHAQRASISQN